MPRLRQPNRRRITVFERVTTPGLLEAKSLRRDDGSGQAVAHQVASGARERRLVDLSSSNPIRWRPCADPVQKRDPGERITQKGLTIEGPLQKGGQKRNCAVPTICLRGWKWWALQDS